MVARTQLARALVIVGGINEKNKIIQHCGYWRYVVWEDDALVRHDTDVQGGIEGRCVRSSRRDKEIDETRKLLQEGVMPDGTLRMSVYNLGLRRKGIETPLAFKDYMGGDIANGRSFFVEKICGQDFSPDGALFLMNPGQKVLNLGSDKGADDSRLSKLTDLVDGIAGGWEDCKCHAIAAAVTAADRISEGGDLYEHRDEFFDLFNRYIVNPLRNTSRGIECKTDFEISVTGHVESQDELKIIPENNAADPFLWLIDCIDRQKHPIRYRIERLWRGVERLWHWIKRHRWLILIILVVLVICGIWNCQNSFVDNKVKEGEQRYKKAQEEFSFGKTEKEQNFNKRVESLSNIVNVVKGKWLWFSDAKAKRDVAYTNLLSKYLLLEADAAFLKMTENIRAKKCRPESPEAVSALRMSDCVIADPDVFRVYKGNSNEVKIAKERLNQHRKEKVPEVVTEYNKKYFYAKYDMLETNAVHLASQKYIQGLTNELAVWKQECFAVSTVSNDIADVSRYIIKRCHDWRLEYASNVVSRVKGFGREVDTRLGEIFQFKRKVLGYELRELLTTEEPAAQKDLEKAKRELIEVCRKRYFGQRQFKNDADSYPIDENLSDNLNNLLQGTALTNCVTEWNAELHSRQKDWLMAEYGRISDAVQEEATDYSKFLMRPYKDIGKRVHDFLIFVEKWASEGPEKEQGQFDDKCQEVLDRFRNRYFADEKWKFIDDKGVADYPIAEDYFEEKIREFLKKSRINNVESNVIAWVSQVREMQKNWLIGAICLLKEFRDGFDGFDSENGSRDDIRNVFKWSWMFISNAVSGDAEDSNRVQCVRDVRSQLAEAMKKKYFEDTRFLSTHSFPTKEDADWVSCYKKAKNEISKGLSGIFENTDTGFEFVAVRDEWMLELQKRERDWLIESSNQCKKAVSEFDGEANTIVGFITQHSGNPFLWEYVQGVKTRSNDFGIENFKSSLENYANDDENVELDSLKEQFSKLLQNARVLSINAKSNSGMYAGLYDIFTLRHLYTNAAPANVVSRSDNVVSRSDKIRDVLNNVKHNVKQLSEELNDDNWFSSKYKIQTVKVTLSHPEGVVGYTTDGRNIMDIFKMDVKRIEIDGKVDIDGKKFLSESYNNIFSIGEEGQAPDVWNEHLYLDDYEQTMNLNLFAVMKFEGSYSEEYIRRGKNPRKINDAHWEVRINVPHLKTAKGLTVCSPPFRYASFANKGPGDHTQEAELNVTVEGECVGPTPYDRIDTCMNKAKEIEDDEDEANVWKRKFKNADLRVKELNKILDPPTTP